jgi:hypothetical protein
MATVLFVVKASITRDEELLQFTVSERARSAYVQAFP